MKASKRLEIIIDEMQTSGTVGIAGIGGCLGCSEVTIKNDTRKLDQRGVLKKTYGGTVRGENGLSVEFIPEEYFLDSNKKYRITKRAYEYIEGGDSIIIDDPTTGYYLAKYIKEHVGKHLAVVTNSILSGVELTSTRHADLFIAGGRIIGNPPTAPSSIAVGAMGQLHTDKTFMGVNRINLGTDLTSMGTPQIDVKREMIRVADEVYVIADSSKFGSRNLFTVRPMSEVDGVITDTEIKKEYVWTARNLGIELNLI